MTASRPLGGAGSLGSGKRRPGNHSSRNRSSGGRLATLGALGVVFGDIGTSPLYALHTAFSMDHNAVGLSSHEIYGVISMVLWTITLIVTVKYVVLVIRADNGGEGGILALLALLQRRMTGRRRMAVLTVLGMLGAALFYGDSVITPAISVMSAVEGLSVVSPELGHAVVPVSALILALLFLLQPVGTGRVSRAFGPVMLLWLAVMAIMGLPQIIAHPQILGSLSPHWAIELVLRQPLPAFVLMGAIVLTVTGAEALYADLGHFGAKAVRRAWLTVAMPALAIVYLGQGAAVISAPDTAGNPFFHLAPPVLQLPLVILATLATVIASQAVISGAFSVTVQAIRLGLLPRLVVRHTSREEGQVYLPTVNGVLFTGVMVLVLAFGSSAELANAYGLAVTGTLLLESVIFLVFAYSIWRWPWWAVGAYVTVIGLLEVVLLAANSTKILSGGWIPLLLAALVLTVMVTWHRGRQRMVEARRRMEGELREFIATVQDLRRIPGVAVFPHPFLDTTPLALLRCVESFGVLHERVVIVRVVAAGVPHVRPGQRIQVRHLGSTADGIVHVTVTVGFLDAQDIPRNLALTSGHGPELDLDLDSAHYFISILALLPPHTHPFRSWGQRLFLALERNQADRTEVFHLPPTRTVVMGSELPS
ncbi:potassium transporter Kup [Microbacterium sp. A93]|uniref:potassium transporter Kup n=1 Tax=Microbacterium sp. A93 TaxID=3450716 RepID=UPI003F43B55A